MTESFPFGGTVGHTPGTSSTREVAGLTCSNVIDLPPTLGQPRLPVELLIGIVEWLAIPPAHRSFRLGQGSLRTLVALGLANQTLNRLVTPVLYHRIRLTTSSAIRSFYNTLSNLPRGTYLSTFVKYFFAYDETDRSTACIQDIVSLIRDSVEYIHIDKWPSNSSASDLRDRFASVRTLRQLSINEWREADSPIIHLLDRSTLESVVLNDLNAIRMVREIISDASKGGPDGAVGRHLAIYCIVDGVASCFLLQLMVGAYFQRFLATGKELPPFRIVMFFIETSTLPPQLLHFSPGTLRDRWFCLPVSALFRNLRTVEFQQWLRSSIEDGSLWEINPIPMSEWATWARENVGQHCTQDNPSVIDGPQTQPN